MGIHSHAVALLRRFGAVMTRRQLLRLAAGVMLASLMGCAQTSESQLSATVFNFDTVCTIGGSMTQEVLDEACALCGTFEQLFSRTIATSDVGRINAAAGEAVEVDPRTADVIRRSLAYSEESDGLFDITIGSVSELWDFTEGIVPGEQAVADALKHVGWQNVHVEGATVRLVDPLARIDLGGIAKGYIADAVVDLLRERGITSASVNLGGNVVVLGTKLDGSPWGVGVRDPDDPSGANVIARVGVTDGSVVTSGLYERSFERHGRRYWHILDPRTGYPVETDVVSASIYSERSIDGDGCTKPLFMWGVSESLHRLEQKPQLQALLVTRDGAICTTPASDFEILGSDRNPTEREGAS